MKKNNFQKSAANLKKAVPLMVKHHVPATPANYALWYTYVDQTVPELNEQVDALLKDYDVLPPVNANTLYREHIANKAEVDLGNLKQNMEALVSEVSSSMTDAIADTSDFSKVLTKSFDGLSSSIEGNNNPTLDEVMPLIQELVDEANDIRHSTDFIHNQLKSASDEISRLKIELAKVQCNAMFDSLTSIYNRGAFDADLTMFCDAKQPMSLIFLDIDHFKKFNDELGHLFGDTILKGIAQRLKQACRGGISAYRFGGEEFALIVPNKSLRVARQMADTIRLSIEKMAIKDRKSGNKMGNVTASFGVAEFVDGDTYDSLVGKADKQLYDAKRSGRNRVMPY
ncbi:GGDEF domain-containing protein [Vibrio sp. ZSDZ65]|uniref:diguanylate cyclase n=1 Tax=Vibrio qingdaonensis TaxID=2829491 RepID=A0A9X3CM35_9VIBR|nr:GGDEF domain-containing protein [Vibrio qingdaonensis]MCW8345913.1 GGDEF domain-containing protein [Vibrio qingdaonensis]